LYNLLGTVLLLMKLILITPLKNVGQSFFIPGSSALLHMYSATSISFLDVFHFVLENTVASCEDSVKCICFPEEVFLVGDSKRKLGMSYLPCFETYKIPP
jgi:hypothetical protein